MQDQIMEEATTTQEEAQQQDIKEEVAPLPEEAQKVVDKVIDKVVRIEITDHREYIGKIMCVDKTKSIFLQDALEVIDRSAAAEAEGRYLYHELFSPYLLGATDK